jgi:hypothetical protein
MPSTFPKDSPEYSNKVKLMARQILWLYREESIQTKAALTNRNSVVSTSWKLRFGVCHENVKFFLIF